MKIFLRPAIDNLIIHTIFEIIELIEDERRCHPEGGRQNALIEWRFTILCNKAIGELGEPGPYSTRNSS